jgi:hypothetical protein
VAAAATPVALLPDTAIEAEHDDHTVGATEQAPCTH